MAALSYPLRTTPLMNDYTTLNAASQAVIALETPAQTRSADALIARVFGPGRLAKTAERLREGSKPFPELCFVAEVGREVIGSVRLWPIVSRASDEEVSKPFAFLGPIGVDPALQGDGIGRALVHACLEAADAMGLEAVLLVGAHTYFQRFGFEVAQGLILPGPVDKRRLLIRMREGAVAPEGRVEIAPQITPDHVRT
jgi:predicted N-acetyltransferase YhbS